MAVTILEVCQVAPPLEAAPICLPLTFFDLLWLKLAPVQRLFFYQAPPNLEQALFSHLKHSLSLSLRYFPVLAGHLTWPHTSPTPTVFYELGDSLALTLARSDSDFRQLSSNELRPAEESHPLVPVLAQESGSRIPVLAVQVTVFENCGFCIGITAHHAILDGNSSTAFLKTWASIAKFGENRELAPCFDRNNRFSDLDNLYGNIWLRNVGAIRDNLSPWEFVPPPGKVRGTFELNGLKIQKLKELVTGKGVSGVSSFTVAYAYVLVCLVKAKKVETQRVIVIILADFRARLDPPLPASYVGNCIQPSGVIFETRDLLADDGFVFATRELSKGIETYVSGGIEGAENWLMRMFERMGQQVDTLVSVAGSNRFGFYGVDFGWGKPARVETTSIGGTGAISFSDGKDGSGIEMGLVLSKDEIDTFASLFEQRVSDI